MCIRDSVTPGVDSAHRPRGAGSPTKGAEMSAVRVHNLAVSLDGFATGDDQRLEAPFGHAGTRLMEWFFPTATFQGMTGDRERQAVDPATEADDSFARGTLDGIGVEIMGANKFGPPGWHDDPEWRGWWGENPPFHTPVIVLTHRPHAPIELEGGTTFHFMSASPAAVSYTHLDVYKRQVSERENFPTDLYMVEGMIEFLDRGYELRLIDDELSAEQAIGDDTAVVLLTQVNYRSGRQWNLNGITELAHSRGALIIWDLCHSVGAVPIALDAAGADFAVGCTYKYLNGGPGSPAFIWVAERHAGRARQPLSGWWGHKSPFEMAVSFEPVDGARRFLTGTQPIISLATMELSLIHI